MSRRKFLQVLSVHVQVCKFHKIDILTRKLLQLDLRSLLEGKWEVENFFTAFYKTITAFTKLLQLYKTFTKYFKAFQNA